MNQIYIDLLFFILFLAISTMFHVAGSYIACKFYKIKVDKIQIFYGSPIFEFKIKNMIVSLGWLPTGGSVSYDYENDFIHRSKITKVIVSLSGSLAIIISAAIILNPVKAFSSVYTGFTQIINGALSPIAEGKLYLSHYFLNLLPKSIIIAYAVMATKIAAANLLNYSGLKWGNALIELFMTSDNLRKRVALMNIGFLIMLAILVCWLIAFISFILGQI